MGEEAEEEWPWDLLDMEPEEADLFELQRIVGLAQGRFHRKPVPDELAVHDLFTEKLDELGFNPANHKSELMRPQGMRLQDIELNWATHALIAMRPRKAS